jgi:hypothetical protein
LSINDKATMYKLLQQGVLGNTIPQYNSLDEWLHRDKALDIGNQWGIRCPTPGGKGMMPVSEYDVMLYYHCLCKENDVRYMNISSFIDNVVEVYGWYELSIIERDLYIYGMPHPPKGPSWRELMPTHGRSFNKGAAWRLMTNALNELSFLDIIELLEKYPGHVIEISVLDRCIGRIPGRNYVTWEIRNY